MCLLRRSVEVSFVHALLNCFLLQVALHMRATKTFKDIKGVVRKTGEEWLISFDDTEAHIPDVYEEVVGVVKITTLTNRQYCVILDPVGSDGKPQLGQKKLIRGEKSFFLQPGEKLESGIQNVYVLGEDEGLILRATEAFADDEAKMVGLVRSTAISGHSSDHNMSFV